MTKTIKEAKDLVSVAQTVLLTEAAVLKEAATVQMGKDIVNAAELILKSKGKLVVMGLGKSGLVGQKIAATFCSTGTPAVFLHAAEAMHGDLGIYQPGDPTLLISKSGCTAELVRLMPFLRQLDSPLIVIVGKIDAPIAIEADIVLNASIVEEADPLGIVPTSSAILTMAIGDALASTLMEARAFKKEDFARFHPAGQLGRNLLLHVSDVMHKTVAWVQLETSFHQVVIAMTERPLGAACVVDADGALLGLITDGDIRRALQTREDIRGLTARDIMKENPVSIAPEATLGEAVALMEERASQISVLPVVGLKDQCCLGLFRLHDVYQPSLT